MEKGPASAEFERRVRRDPGEAVRLAKSLLREDPASERLTVLLWALTGVPSEEVIDLCWEVLVRVSWDERCDAGAYASKTLQIRIGHHAEVAQRNVALARLLAVVQTHDDRANLGLLAWRQGSLGDLPPLISAEFAHAVLHDPDRFPLPRSFSSLGDVPRGNRNAWRLLLLAGRASVPLLAEDLLCGDRNIRAGAQWCLERILLTTLKDMGWEYSPDMTPEQLEKLRQDGLVGDIRRQAR